jgi:hypothetical protein
VIVPEPEVTEVVRVKVVAKVDFVVVADLALSFPATSMAETV